MSAAGFPAVRSRGGVAPSVVVIQRSELVDQASAAPTALLVKITFAPSGVRA